MNTEIILVLNKQSFPVIIIKLHKASNSQIYAEMYECNLLSKTYRTTGFEDKRRECLEFLFTGTFTNLEKLAEDGYTVITVNDDRKCPAQIV